MTDAGHPLPDPALLERLRRAVGDHLVDGTASRRRAAAHDASHFLLTPLAVARAEHAGHVASLLSACHDLAMPLAFRSGGTSLSGQAGTDGVLVDVRRHFRSLEILDEGRRVRVGPGRTLRSVNDALAPFGRKLGPDPASEIACTVGGVVANNSSGMECGTTANTYRTIDSMTIVLPTGTLIDTADDAAARILREQEPDLHEGLLGIRDRLRAAPHLLDEIERQFSIKNTMGYGLNAFVDFDDPIDILVHLVVGSEGSLAFIAEVTLRTIPLLPYVRSSLLVFDDVASSIAALPALTAAGPRSIELIDPGALRVAQRSTGSGAPLGELSVARHAALLIDVAAETVDDLEEELKRLATTIADLDLATPAYFAAEKARAELWRIRKGLYPAVAGARRPGSSALLEDFAVPPSQLLPAVQQLDMLLRAAGYDDAVIFGHAKDGNLHFMINPDLGSPTELDRYERFTEDLVDLVLEHRGTLKAEHGTGRAMAPFVRRQYGSELYEVMVQIKRLFDERGILAPGVIITDRPRAHLESLKAIPPVDPGVDQCVECGYCEVVCPSRDLTTTPRQRIALLREIETVEGDERAQLEAEFSYLAVETCAADSMCQTVCPVHIDTGQMMKQRRADSIGRVGQAAGAAAARHFAGGITGVQVALRTARRTPTAARLTTDALRALGNDDWIPSLANGVPAPGPRRVADGSTTHPSAVYFPSCVNSVFGPESGEHPSVQAAVRELCSRAGVDLRTPTDIASLCCGTPWESKGLWAGAREMRSRVAASLARATEDGRIPVVVDASSCTQGLRRHQTAGTDVVDVVTFVVRQIMPRLSPVPKLERLALHPTCSTEHLGIHADLMEASRFCADEVVVPPSWGCCGFAGDRGLLHPELTQAATRDQTDELLADGRFDAYVSHNRTCELALSRSTGQHYTHIVQLLAELTARD